MKKYLFATLLSAFSMIAAAAEYQMVFKSSKDGSIFNCGEDITFTAQLLIDGKVAENSVVEYVLYHNGKKVKEGKQPVSEKPLSVTTRLDKPGWAHIYCTFKDSKGKTYRREVMWRGKKEIRNVSGGIGGMAEPHKIDIAIKEPADFDEFWSNVRKNVHASQSAMNDFSILS